MAAYLRTGSTGENVRQLQEVLNFLVKPQPLLKVDGIFGPKTQASVVQFQELAKLSADGIVGPLTSKALVGSVLGTLARPGGARLV
jgi:peptidoglycan hydrolase-like protein with peptidoglycan-binding domain